MLYEVITIGVWMEVEIGYRQGDKHSGRFYVAVKRESDPAMIPILDVTDWTYHPDSPKPVPLVITSYSIHYTKLYEMLLQAMARGKRASAVKR